MAAETFQARFKRAPGAINHTPSSAVSAGDVVIQGTMFGAATQDIAADALGALQVEGVMDIVKITGTIAVGVAVYWDADADPLGGTAGTGACTATSSGNTFIGFVEVAAASGDQFATVLVIPAVSVTASGAASAIIDDPGNAGAIPATDSGSVAVVTGGAETRTLSDPSRAGLLLNLYLKTDGGDCVITTASPMNQTGNNTLTGADVGDHICLMSIEDGADFEWRLMANDGWALSTV